MYVAWVLTGVWWPAVALTLIVLVMCLIYFNTFYELLPDGILLSCGLLSKAVPYRAIISVTDADSISPSYCLSSKRVMIRYIEGDEIKYTYASPANRAQFRELLNKAMTKYAETLKKEAKTELDIAVSKAKKENIAQTKAEERAAVNIENQLKAETQEKMEKPKLGERVGKIVNKNDDKILTREQQQKMKEEKKLLARLRKQKEKETKIALKQEQIIKERQIRAQREQSKLIEKRKQTELKKSSDEAKEQTLNEKLENQQKKLVKKETAKANKLEAKREARDKKLSEANKALAEKEAKRNASKNTQE